MVKGLKNAYLMHFPSLHSWFRCSVCFYLKCSSSHNQRVIQRVKKHFFCQNLFQIMYNQKQKSNVHLRKKHKTADRKGGGRGGATLTVSLTVKYPFFLLTTSLSSQKRKISCNELHELGWVVWVTFICIDTEAVILPWSWTMVTQFLVWKIQCNKKCVNSTCNESHACMKGKKVFSVGPLYKNDTAEYMIL